ncbi:MAG: tetratricopeptide repeat protein [Anaerolineae bacterium]
MFCEKCGARIDEGVLYCLQCGYPIHVQSPSTPVTLTEEEPLPDWLWLLASALLGTFLLLGILGLGVAGVYQGLQERARLSREAATVHYDRGLLYMEQGNYELAQAEFEEALRLAPDYQAAREQLAEMRGLFEVLATPTSEVRNQAAESFLEQARALYSQGEWEKAAEKLAQLRALDPDFERDQVEELLFTAHYNRGLELVEAGRLEEAMRYFDKALEVRPGDPSALGQKKMARLYLAGLASWGDWPQTIETFEALYRLKADYRDAALRLCQAYQEYGDLYASEGAWCLAQAQYGRAAEINPTEAIMAKWQEATRRCAEAVAAQGATPQPSQRRFVGQLAGYVDISSNRAQVRGRVLDTQGQGLPGVEVRISALGWWTTATTDGDGYYAFDGLTSRVRYALTLTQFPSQPVEVTAQRGKQATVNFVEVR